MTADGPRREPTLVEDLEVIVEALTFEANALNAAYRGDEAVPIEMRRDRLRAAGVRLREEMATATNDRAAYALAALERINGGPL